MKIHVKVHPSSGRQEITKQGDGSFIVHLKSPPENNKANAELVKLLHNYFKARISIKSGKTSRKKIVEIINE